MISLRHIGLTVVDIDRSLKFYRDLLGFEIIKDMEESGKHIDNFSGVKNIKVRTVKMKNGGEGLIELLQYYSHPSFDSDNQNRPITNIGCSHFAVTVSNLDALYSKLISKGIYFNSEPQYSPDGYAKVAFCKDPDGILIELVEVVNYPSLKEGDFLPFRLK